MVDAKGWLVLLSGRASLELHFSFSSDFGHGWEDGPLQVLLHGLLVWSKNRFAVFAKTRMGTGIDQAPLLSLMAFSTNVSGFEL